jgi:hypothetical protein
MWTEAKLRGSLKHTGLRIDEVPVPPKPLSLRATGRGSAMVLNVALVVSLWFLSTYVLKYLTVTQDTYGIFWPRREWLLAHIAGGAIALLLGPFQLRIGWSRRQPMLHRVLGVAYVLAVAISSIASLKLAFNTDFGWLFGMGLTFMAVAWMVTTSLAIVAIARKIPEQHREWIIRSYVVTFGFVMFRLSVTVLEWTGVGTLSEQLVAGSWLCWSVPLLVTEVGIQGRKIFRRRK